MPTLLFPAGGDVDCVPIIDEIKKHKGCSGSFTKRYDDQVHGGS